MVAPGWMHPALSIGRRLNWETCMGSPEPKLLVNCSCPLDAFFLGILGARLPASGETLSRDLRPTSKLVLPTMTWTTANALKNSDENAVQTSTRDGARALRFYFKFLMCRSTYPQLQCVRRGTPCISWCLHKEIVPSRSRTMRPFVWFLLFV